MEFWGAEVKSGEPLKVQPGEGMILHLSQASIGEVKKEKGSEPVCLFVNVDGKKLVLGTLFSDRLPQQLFDLVFDRDFELSHNWKSGSIYFYGYKASNPDEEEGGGFGYDSDEEMENFPLFANNVKPETKVKPAGVEKVNAGKGSGDGKQKVKIVEPNKDVQTAEGNEDSKEYVSDDVSTDEDMDEDEDESDSGEDEETPKKVETGKKRAAESATKTPVPDKKAKVATPKRTDGEKGGGHVATPHPSKKAGKTPANKSKEQTPKSLACSSCNKSFASESALQSHSKAKHSAGK